MCCTYRTVRSSTALRKLTSCGCCQVRRPLGIHVNSLDNSRCDVAVDHRRRLRCRARTPLPLAQSPCRRCVHAGNMEPIGSINKRGQAGPVERFLPSFRVRKCHICGTNDGCTIRCHTSACRFHLHPMCGSKAGSVYMEIETSTKRAADGTEYETVNLVARCPK